MRGHNIGFRSGKRKIIFELSSILLLSGDRMGVLTGVRIEGGMYFLEL